MNKGHLGHYPVGALVVLGEWIYPAHSPGMVVSREWRYGPYPPHHKIVAKYEAIGVVLVEHEITRARTECDAHTPVSERLEA